jgi:hypothetical protein
VVLQAKCPVEHSLQTDTVARRQPLCHDIQDQGVDDELVERVGGATGERIEEGRVVRVQGPSNLTQHLLHVLDIRVGD